MTTKRNSNTTPAAAKPITIALMGNPNCGKTTIFNNLTGSHQKVGNYGGVTVDTKEGICHHQGQTVRVVDLPGTYSLTAFSIEEVVARNFILQEKPDVIVNVIDGSNLERNLYLPLQLAELNVPLMLVINMADEMKRKGIEIKRKVLVEQLGAPLVFSVGTKNIGTDKLLATAVALAQQPRNGNGQFRIDYGPDLEGEIEKLCLLLDQAPCAQGLPDARESAPPAPPDNARWIAIKMLEGDAQAAELVHCPETRQVLQAQLEISRERIRTRTGEDADMVIAEERFNHIHQIHQKVTRQGQTSAIDASDRIDKVLTNRALGLPIFAALMYVTFLMVFTLGAYPMGWIETGIEWLTETVADVWPQSSLPILRSLLLDGVIAGVGGVIVFLPNIMLLFFALALLEDTGYMARAAFLMDRLMKWVGLHGKSFIPMLSGFGCSVPGILGTRILDNERDRLTTILVLPLMSCGARLPIYMLIAPAFFAPAHASLVVFGIYLIGIVLAVVGAKILRLTVLKGDPSPFVMEMPPYRIPTLKAVSQHTWDRSWQYLQKAGTVILAISIVMWAITTYPNPSPEQMETMALGQTDNDAPVAVEDMSDAQKAQVEIVYSIAGRIGKGIEPVLQPLGFDWKIGTALIGAFAAKEVFVAQMGIVYAVGDTVDTEAAEPQEAETQRANLLRQRLRADYSPLVGFCIMLFCLISTPCMATFAATRREAGLKWAFVQFASLTVEAYVITMAVYQIGSRVGPLLGV